MSEIPQWKNSSSEKEARKCEKDTSMKKGGTVVRCRLPSASRQFGVRCCQARGPLSVPRRQPATFSCDRESCHLFPSFLLLSPHICFVIPRSLIAAVSHAIFSHCFSPANRCCCRRCIFETVPTASRHPVSGLPLFVSTASPSWQCCVCVRVCVKSPRKNIDMRIQ